MATFSPVGTNGVDMGLTVLRPLFGQNWTFVLTIPQQHWTAYFARISPNPVPGDPTTAYNQAPVLWNMLAKAFADYASTIATPGAPTHEIDGATPSASWVVQWGLWYKNTRGLTHPMFVDEPNTYAAICNAAAATQFMQAA